MGYIWRRDTRGTISEPFPFYVLINLHPLPNAWLAFPHWMMSRGFSKEEAASCKAIKPQGESIKEMPDLRAQPSKQEQAAARVKVSQE